MNNLMIEQLVVVKENNLSPLNWRVGRITAVFPGIDNKVSVISVKTPYGEIKRCVTKLCLLPTAN